MTKIANLPAEILENIFVFLDGQTLCQSEKVCRAWHEVIKHMKRNNCLWRRICRTEIPEIILEEMLSNKPVPFQDQNIIDWRVIYKKWFLGRLINSWPYWKKHIQAFDSNPVTCVKLSGSFVVTGHSNGSVCVWNLHNGELQQKSLLHLKMITDIAMVDLLNLGFYGSPDLSWGHHHIVTVAKDSCIRVSSLLGPTIDLFDSDVLNVQHHSDVLETVRVFGNYLAVCCRDNTVTMWKMELVKQPHYEMKLSLLHNIIGPPDYLRSFGFWHGEIQCVSFSGKMKSWKSSSGNWVEIKNFHDPNSTDELENIVSVTSAFIFRNKTVIMFTADGKMIVSVANQSQCYELMKTLRSLVVSVALHGTTLAIGAENGKLFLYYVPQIFHLLKLQLSEPNLCLTLSEASITSLDILNNEDSPVIAACTTESIFIIKWYPPSSTHQMIRRRSLTSLFKSHES